MAKNNKLFGAEYDYDGGGQKCKTVMSLNHDVDDLKQSTRENLCGQEQQTGGGRLCKTIVDGCIIYIISTCMVSLRKKDKRNNNKF